MTEKTKRIVLIAVCCALCVAVGVGIVTRFGGSSNIPSGAVSDDPANSRYPTVDIDPAADGNSEQRISVDIQGQNSDSIKVDPAQGADSSGTEQTIQADPVKPEAPQKPEAPTGTTNLPNDHTADDVPEDERNIETPPTYDPGQITVSSQPNTPKMGDTNEAGQIYVEGFGWVTPGGANIELEANDMYENGNKIGIMGD